MQSLCCTLLLLLLGHFSYAQDVMAGEEMGVVSDSSYYKLDLDRFVVADVMPTPINLNELKQQIVYPKKAREMGIEGKVFIRVLVGEDGIPIKHEVLRSPHPWLTEAALAGIDVLRFSPAMREGKAIEFWTTIPIDFSFKTKPPTFSHLPPLFRQVGTKSLETAKAIRVNNALQQQLKQSLSKP